MNLKEILKKANYNEASNQSIARKMAKDLVSDIESAGDIDGIMSTIKDFMSEFEDNHGEQASGNLNDDMVSFIQNALSDEFNLAQILEQALDSSEEEEEVEENSQEDNIVDEKDFEANMDKAIKALVQAEDAILASLSGGGEDKDQYFNIVSPQAIKKISRVKSMIKGLQVLVDTGEK